MTVGGADTVLPFNNKFDYGTLATSYNGDIFENTAGSINDGWADTSNSGIPHTFDTIVPLERNKKHIYGINNEINYIGNSWIEHWAWSEYKLQVIGKNDIIYHSYTYTPEGDNEAMFPGAFVDYTHFCDLFDFSFVPRDDDTIIYRVILIAHNGSGGVHGSAMTILKIKPIFKYK